jgi:hypothetical protein
MSDTPATTPSAEPPFWEIHVPRYKAMRDLKPAEKARFRHEPPFSQLADNDVWQYADPGKPPVERGAVIMTRCWPHPSFLPLNYAAFRVLEFFNARQKSRLPVRPWRVDRIVLDDGLTGPTQPQISIVNKGNAA